MANSEGSLKDSKKFWILDPAIPDIDFPNPQFIRQVNTIYSIPFGYTGSCLLSPEGKRYAEGLDSITLVAYSLTNIYFSH
jgi:hypothetical protein